MKFPQPSQKTMLKRAKYTGCACVHLVSTEKTFGTVTRQGNVLTLVKHNGEKIPSRITSKSVTYPTSRIAKQHMENMKSISVENASLPGA